MAGDGAKVIVGARQLCLLAGVPRGSLHALEGKGMPGRQTGSPLRFDAVAALAWLREQPGAADATDADTAELKRLTQAETLAKARRENELARGELVPEPLVLAFASGVGAVVRSSPADVQAAVRRLASELDDARKAYARAKARGGE